MNSRIEIKVSAATVTAAATALVLHYLFVLVPDLAALSVHVEVIVTAIVTALATFAAGFFTRHTTDAERGISERSF